MNPFFTKVAVREDVWQGKPKTFVINLHNCCVLDRGWPLSDSRPRVTLRWHKSGRRTPRDVVEVIARELIQLQHTNSTLYALLQADYAFEHTTLGGLPVNEVLDSLPSADGDQNYEVALRYLGACKYNNRCFSPFHCGVMFCSEEVTPDMLKRCTDAFIQDEGLISHPRASITIGVPIYAYHQARAEFLAEKAKEAKREQLRISQLLEAALDEFDAAYVTAEYTE